MNEWATVPVFGQPTPGFVATIRPSAYAIIANQPGQIALARAPQGVFLPGGGMMPGETVAAAVRREVREECGLTVVAGSWCARAIEHVFSAAERTQFTKRSTFCVGILEGRSALPIEEMDHFLEWAAPADALVMLSPASHQWAVRRWMESGAADR